jgi:hypothetical protein
MRHCLSIIIFVFGLMLAFHSHAEVPVSIKKLGSQCTYEYNSLSYYVGSKSFRCAFWIPARATQNAENYLFFNMNRVDSRCPVWYVRGGFYFLPTVATQPNPPGFLPLADTQLWFNPLSDYDSERKVPSLPSYMVDAFWPRTLVVEFSPEFPKDCIRSVELVTRVKG